VARIGLLHKMSYAELAAVRAQVDHAMVEEQNAARIAPREKLADMAKDAGLTLDEVFGKGESKGNGRREIPRSQER
jgi:hypothetical protein